MKSSENPTKESSSIALLGKTSPKQTKYFRGFKKPEIKAIQENLAKEFNFPAETLSLEQLDEIVDRNKKVYWAYRIENNSFLVADTTYTFFQITTSKDGVEGAVKIFRPDDVIPEAVGYGIGVPLAVVDWGFNMLLLDSHKEAVKSTLKYHFSPSKVTQVTDYFKSLKSQPASTLKNTAKTIFSLNALKYTIKFTADKSIIIIHNFTGGVANILDFYTPIYDYSPGLAYAALAATLYTSNGYYNKAVTPKYHAGYDFWLNRDKKRPWLAIELGQGICDYLKGHKENANIAIPVRVLVQGLISTVGLRSFPSFYYLAIAASEKFGWWLNPTIAAVVVGLHTAMSRYPRSYKYYMNNLIEIREYLTSLFMEDIHQFVDSRLRYNEWTPEEKIRREPERQKFLREHTENFCRYFQSMFETEIKRENGRGYLFKKEKWQVLPLGYETALGGFLGYQSTLSIAATIANPYLAMIFSIASVLTGAGIFAFIGYKGEEHRVTDGLVLAKLKKSNLEDLKKNWLAAQDEEKNKSANAAKKALAEKLSPMIEEITKKIADLRKETKDEKNSETIKELETLLAQMKPYLIESMTPESKSTFSISAMLKQGQSEAAKQSFNDKKKVPLDQTESKLIAANTTSQELDDDEEEEEKESTCNMATAAVISVCSAIGRGLSNSGSGVRTFGKENIAGVAYSVFGSFHSSLNQVHTFFGDVKEGFAAFRDLVSGCPKPCTIKQQDSDKAALDAEFGNNGGYVKVDINDNSKTASTAGMKTPGSI